MGTIEMIIFAVTVSQKLRFGMERYRGEESNTQQYLSGLKSCTKIS